MTMSYSSKQFYRDWRYAVDKEFVDADGHPYEYADDGKQAWGDELKCFEFTSSPNTAAISHDGKHLAIAVDHDIHLVNTKDYAIRVLRGHTSRIDALAFQPGDADMLVSCAMNYTAGSTPTEPTILFWELSTHTDKFRPPATEIVKISKRAVRTVVEGLTDLDTSLHPTVMEQDCMATSFQASISEALIRGSVDQKRTLYGRLASACQSEVFSPSGKFMMYLPGPSPPSNGDEQWDVKIYSMGDRKDVLTLTGHRDNVMWLGYSPDDELIGTVSWDKTMKIWNAGTGHVKYTFQTNSQNWTGGFSPDGKMFAGTCGDGSIHVYDLADGTEIFWSDFGKRWCRALDWSSDSKLLVVGGLDRGKMVLIDVEKQQVVQERILSTALAQVNHEELRRMLGGFMEVGNVEFVAGGGKIVYLTSGDGSAEIYDLEKHKKWRFARAGTDSYAEAAGNLAGTRDGPEAAGKRPEKGGHGMVSWEDCDNGVVMLATVDGDAVRLWSVPR